MKQALIILAFLPTVALADKPWVRDCVTWWGGDIPKEQRTKENCPNGSNHWDHSGTGAPAIATSTSTVITNNSTYVVNRVGNTVSVIRSGK